MRFSLPDLRSCVVLLLAAAALAACSRTPAPPPPAPGAQDAAAPDGSQSEVGIRTGALTEPQAAALHQQIMDDASHRAQQLQSRRRYDTVLFGAEENHRVTVEHCGTLTGDQQLDCRRQADTDLDAARAQARALYLR